MGGKCKIAKEILPIILADRKPGQYFVDIFCGGANVLDKVENPRIGNDINSYVIALLDEIAHGWEPPIHYLKRNTELSKQIQIIILNLLLLSLRFLAVLGQSGSEAMREIKRAEIMP